MERVTKIKVRGVSILRVDFSEATPDEILATIIAAKAIILHAPERSVLTLTLTKGARYDTRVSEAMKRYAVQNKPFVKAAAVVGLSGLQQILYSAIIRLSGRTMSTFDDEDDARVWLASYTEKQSLSA
jgi:hypothetical protein